MTRKFNVSTTRVGLILTGGRGHVRKACPCMRCFRWRQATFSPLVFGEMQERIRQRVMEDMESDPLVDAVLSA